MKVVGTGNELDIEALAALQPDLIVGYGSGDNKGASWTWWDEAVTEKATKIAPFVGVQFSDQPVVDVIAEYEALAKALGGDLDQAVVTARTTSTAAPETSDTTAAKAELTAIALNGDTANPSGWLARSWPRSDC